MSFSLELCIHKYHKGGNLKLKLLSEVIGKPPSLSELTMVVFIMELIHLGLQISIYNLSSKIKIMEAFEPK